MEAFMVIRFGPFNAVKRVEIGGNKNSRQLTRETVRVTAEQQALIAEIRNVFGDRNFDTSSVLGAVSKWSVTPHPKLAAAIEGAVPGCRQRRTKEKLLRRVLTGLAAEGYFTTDKFGWWYLKGESKE
jgi:hypothetical protein